MDLLPVSECVHLVDKRTATGKVLNINTLETEFEKHACVFVSVCLCEFSMYNGLALRAAC